MIGFPLTTVKKAKQEATAKSLVSLAAGFAAGAAIGAAIGLLFAPKTGEETRKVIAEKSKDVFGTVKEKCANVVDTVKEKINKCKEADADEIVAEVAEDAAEAAEEA